MVLVGVNQGGGLRPSFLNTVVIMTRTQMTELIEAQSNMFKRVKRYGMYWNTIANVDITERSWAVNNAFRAITEALKESRLIMEYIHEMPVTGLTPIQLNQVHYKIRQVHVGLDYAWIWMSTDPIQGVSCFDEAWDAEYEEPRDIDARDTHLYEG